MLEIKGERVLHCFQGANLNDANVKTNIIVIAMDLSPDDGFLGIYLLILNNFNRRFNSSVWVNYFKL